LIGLRQSAERGQWHVNRSETGRYGLLAGLKAKEVNYYGNRRDV